jgi:aldose 1-epimerase
VEEIEVDRKAELAQAAGLIRAEDFGVGWPSSTDLHIRWVLRPDALSLQVTARNVGDEDVPIGIGWHPYFALPSGRREQARMRVPARSHVVVNDYDEVLPTGEIRPVQGTRFDFRAPQGAPLGEAYLDDCFVDIDKTAAGETVCEVFDPPSQHALRVRASSPEVSAIQTFTRPDRPFVVIEPQFNWADPFGAEWGAAHDTGMVLLKPQHSVDYCVQLELFTSA